MCTCVQKMTKEQLSCEKTVLQKNLLHYEGLHGRPVSLQHLDHLSTRPRARPLKPPLCPSFCPQVTREERMVVKPLYDRYRLVKQMLTRVSITPVTVREQKKKSLQLVLSHWKVVSVSRPLYRVLVWNWTDSGCLIKNSLDSANTVMTRDSRNRFQLLLFCALCATRRVKQSLVHSQVFKVVFSKWLEIVRKAA